MKNTRTERIGVNATESIILKDFNWIFREQPIVDVGIDALMEECINDNPTGKLIALQIKSGKGNFSISKKKLTYYISNIHRHYWINYDIPVLLIAHLPENNETYWIELSEKTIQKTPTKWKIDIPITNKFNITAKSTITKLFQYRDSMLDFQIINKDNTNQESLYSLAEGLNYIQDANSSIIRIVEIINKIDQHNISLLEKTVVFNMLDYSSHSPERVTTINSYSKNLNMCSKRLLTECSIYSETFSEAFYSYENLATIFLKSNLKNTTYDINLNATKTLPTSLLRASTEITFMKNKISKLPNDYKSLALAKKNLIITLETLSNEINLARKLIISINQKLEKL